MSLAMNAFVYSVNSCSEVSSRDCIIASDKRFCLLFESWFRNPPKKEQKLGEKVSEKNFISSRDGPIKRTETRQR